MMIIAQQYTWITISLTFIVTVLYTYKRLKDTVDYWRVRKVPYVKPNWIFGNIANVIFQRISMGFQLCRSYEQLAPHRYGGLFTLQKPVLLIRDPELIKNVLTKNFYYFHDRGFNCCPQTDPLFQNLFALKGEQWRDVRRKTVSGFSSTSKLKAMIPLIEECAFELVSVLGDRRKATLDEPKKKDKAKVDNNYNHYDDNNNDDDDDDDDDDIQIKDVASRYIIDTIGLCAFGLRTGCLRNAQSIFRLKCKSFFKFRYAIIIRALLPTLPSLIIRWFQLTLAGREVIDFFTHLANETIEYRKTNNKAIRNDLLESFINPKTNLYVTPTTVTDGENEPNNSSSTTTTTSEKQSTPPIYTDTMVDFLASQYYSFFSGGYETTASAMTFFLFEIARHPEVEEKLKTEIDAVLAKDDDRITFESLKDMKYMDMVWAETLRLYPPSPVLFRTCNANYKIDNEDFVIPKGTPIAFSVIGLHHDEKHYKNPEQFNPDNFAEEVKQQRHQYAYLPFGGGPRICIAERFVKIQMKITMIHLIKNFKFRLSSKTKLPLEFNKSMILTTHKNAIRLRCIPRK